MNDIVLTEWHEVAPPAVLKTRTGKEIKYIRPDEVHRVLLSFLDGRDRLLVETLWNTGARVSEALELTPASVNFDESTVTIRTQKKKKRLSGKAKAVKNEIRGLELALAQDPESRILARKLKDARRRLGQYRKEGPPLVYRTVPITPDLSGRIAAYCMAEKILPNGRLFSITRVRVYQILQSAGEKAGIEKGRRHPHVFRHGFAVNAVPRRRPPHGPAEMAGTCQHRYDPDIYRSAGAGHQGVSEEYEVLRHVTY
ncbi:MAG: tyrosine-type recombinase/integrase [Nitrospiraceae bacterium]|nr:tyrosine-type recombinase/integrase [Nitrospiraceae bacterium]